MGKKRGKRPSSGKKEPEDQDVDDVDVNDDSYFDDEIDKFHAEKEKILLDVDTDDEDNYDSDEEEVLAVASDDEDEEDSDQFEKGDKEEEVIAQAWGRKKSAFYGTDIVENLEGSDREEAEREEEEEVLAIQRRLALQIDEDDFDLDMLKTTEKTEDESALKEVVETDFSSLSRKAQWKLLKKQSPELDGLVTEFKEKVSEMETELCPLMQMIRQGLIPQGYGSDFISLKYRVYLAYVMNISFYLVLKTNRTPVHSHPVISRLVQYKTIINSLAPLSKKLKPEIKEVLNEYSERIQQSTKNSSVFDENGEVNINFIEQGKATSLNRGTKRKARVESAKDGNLSVDLTVKGNAANPEFSIAMNEKLEEGSGDEAKSDSDDAEPGEERRAINDKIAKNRGLKQKRRKIDRNPRVKNREKFRKAKIRRKGHVREYRPELKKYSGEASGIRIGVKKSVALQ